MSRKLLLLAHPCPGTWTDHYIRAFRAQHEVVVAGLPPTPERLAKHGREGAADIAERPDVETDLATDFDPRRELGSWEPDLVVGISGIGGEALYSGVAELPWPSAFIAIDTWQCLLDYRQALTYDFVFAAQREFVPLLRAAGSRHVHWLPLAADPAEHFPADAEPDHDIAFAGGFRHPVHARRAALLEALQAEHDVHVAEACYGAALSEAFARGRVAFNHCAVRELNMRIFEVPAMGRPLLTNADAETNGLFDLFEEGEHLFAYDSKAALLRIAGAVLSDEGRRKRVAEAGRELVLSRHTYDHRVRELLDRVDTLLPEPGRPRTEARAPRPSDWLPRVPGRVVDLGMGFGMTRIGMRRSGAEEFAGIAWTPDELRRLGARYDESACWPAEPREAFDVAAFDAAVAPIDLEAGLQWCRAALVAGGSLIVTAPVEHWEAAGAGGEPGPIDTWLQHHDFHLRRMGRLTAEGRIVLEARKRTRRLSDIVSRWYAEAQPAGVDAPGVLARIPSGW